MCWLWYVQKNHINETLINQRDRWLHWLGIVDFDNKKRLTSFKDTTGEYTEYLLRTIKETDKSMCLMHHRKASIGSISIENTHPFVWSKFILAQNWTSREFYAEYKDVYKKETDSETLLSYLEEWANTLEDCVDLLDDIKSSLWIIFIVKGKQTLIYSDSCRESYVEKSINWKYLVSFTNYKPKTSTGYRNWFWMIINSKSWLIKNEYNYNTTYNALRYWTMIQHWSKASKLTINTVAIVPSYTKKKQLVLGGKSNTVSELITKANKVVIWKILNVAEVSNILQEYWVVSGLNFKTLRALSESFFKLITNKLWYEEIYMLSTLDIFNLDSKDIPELEPLTLLPHHYLLDRDLINSSDVKLNLVRHARYMNILSYDWLQCYLEWMEHIVDGLPKYTKEVKFELIKWEELSVTSFLRLMYWIVPDDTSDNSIDWLNDELAEKVVWYIKAWYALWLTAADLEVSEEYFNTITIRY